MDIVSWTILGLIVGLLTKLILPGKNPGGILITLLLGIAGSSIGGFANSLIDFGSAKGFDLHNILIGAAGAVLFLLIFCLIKQ